MSNIADNETKEDSVQGLDGSEDHSASGHKDVVKVFDLASSMLEYDLQHGIQNPIVFGILNGGIKCTIFKFEYGQDRDIRVTWIHQPGQNYTFQYTYADIMPMLKMLLRIRREIQAQVRVLAKTDVGVDPTQTGRISSNLSASTAGRSRPSHVAPPSDSDQEEFDMTSEASASIEIKYRSYEDDDGEYEVNNENTQTKPRSRKAAKNLKPTEKISQDDEDDEQYEDKKRKNQKDTEDVVQTTHVQRTQTKVKGKKETPATNYKLHLHTLIDTPEDELLFGKYKITLRHFNLLRLVEQFQSHTREYWGKVRIQTLMYSDFLKSILMLLPGRWFVILKAEKCRGRQKLSLKISAS